MVGEKSGDWNSLIDQAGKDYIYVRLLDKIVSRQATVAIVGLGYVGLPLSTAFAGAGFAVIGIDIDPSKVEAINSGRSYIRDVSSETLARYVSHRERAVPGASASRGGSLTATTDYDALQEADVIIICVPTPLGRASTPDCSCITAVVDEIASRLHRGMLIILESTSYPGTTEELVLPRLQSASGQVLRAGQDLFLAFSPERIDPGNTRWTVENIPKVVGGLTPACAHLAAALLQQIVPHVHLVSSPRAAEMTKLLENTFRNVNIALVNEMALLAERMGMDIWEIVEAAATKPFGFMPFYPGPGVGGHCIAVDPYYLSWKAREHSFFTSFVDLALEINERMPPHVVELVGRALEERGKGLREAKILLLGVTFKPDVDDTRNAPAIRVMELLLDRGVEVSYHDPYVPCLDLRGNASHDGSCLTLTSTPLDDRVLAVQDCIVVLVHHRGLDYGRVVRLAPLVVDAVNATGKVNGMEGKMVRLGSSLGVAERAGSA